MSRIQELCVRQAYFMVPARKGFIIVTSKHVAPTQPVSLWQSPKIFCFCVARSMIYDESRHQIGFFSSVSCNFTVWIWVCGNRTTHDDVGNKTTYIATLVVFYNVAMLVYITFRLPAEYQSIYPPKFLNSYEYSTCTPKSNVRQKSFWLLINKLKAKCRSYHPCNFWSYSPIVTKGIHRIHQ